MGGEVLGYEFFDKFDSQIWVGSGFDTMTDTGDFERDQYRRSYKREKVTYSACSPCAYHQQIHVG